MSVQTILENSPYLRTLINRHTDLRTDVNPLEQLAKLYQELQEYADSQLTEDDEVNTRAMLLVIKSKFAFYWALADLHDNGTFAERGRWQTRFADLTVQIALAACWQAVAKKHPRIKLTLAEHNGDMPGLFILGLGKLGGWDLNFSSDADLIAYFNPDALPIPAQLGQSYICHQVLQLLTKMLGPGESGDFVWRVDWRLRPNASAATLAISTVAALDYYFYRASPWHRLALMKARVIAGDMCQGKIFKDATTPFVWRQNLDYRALDELGEIKNKINLEHPSLRTERHWREPINDNVAGFNVKLGAGGIREIEFITNALQLVWGGKNYELRTTNTLDALANLVSLQLMPVQQSEELGSAYLFLRKVENAIQIVHNQQDHQLPIESNRQEALLKLVSLSLKPLRSESLSGSRSWASFAHDLNEHRSRVSAYFETLFAEQAQGAPSGVVWPQELDQTSIEIVEGWEKGFIDYGVSMGMHVRLQPLVHALADALNGSTGNGDSPITHDGPCSNVSSKNVNHIVRTLHAFFRSLPQGEPYFRLLAESPSLLNAIIPPLLHSKAMTALLKQSPHIVDCFMHADQLRFDAAFIKAPKFDSDYVLLATNYEVRLERARRFVNEQLYQLYLGFLQGQLKPEQLQSLLYELAIHTLELSLTLVAQHLRYEQIPITVIGMGKMGVKMMAPQSDLDLIFVFEQDKISLDDAIKYVSRLQTAISTPMREGVIYELDTRLRPSGRSGAPIVSVDSFARHQLHKAHTWEHLALVTSEVVAGDMSCAQRLASVKQEVIQQARDQNQFKRDALKMWRRIDEHRIKAVPNDIVNSKFRTGGLMQAEYLNACHILQGDKTGDQQLSSVIRFWRTMQLFERLLGLQDKPLASVPKQYQSLLFEYLGVSSMGDLIQQQETAANDVTIKMNEFFSEIESDFDSDAWQETSVFWSPS